MTINFITSLYTTVVNDPNRKWWHKSKRQLISDFILEIDGKRFVIPKGYIFDGSSIPRPLWSIFPPSYDPAWRASAVHDYFYTHLYKHYSKEFADDVFYRVMLKDGASPLVAKLFYLAVKWFGRGNW